jgi:hypothetical protein
MKLLTDEQNYVQDVIEKLSKLLCRNQSYELQKLFVEKTDLLKSLVDEYRRHNGISCNSTKIENLKKKIRKNSTTLTLKIISCLNTEFNTLREFFSASDSIFIKYAVSTSNTEKEQLQALFNELINKAVFN